MLVKWKATRAARKIPDNIETVKKDFLVRVSDLISEASNLQS